jgi:hypothetical protein
MVLSPIYDQNREDYLNSNDRWKAVEDGYIVDLSPENPLVAQIRRKEISANIFLFYYRFSSNHNSKLAKAVRDFVK